jgi:hypothetical protein
MNTSTRKPKMKSVHAFVDYLAEHLGMVRCLSLLSKKDAILVELDERMGERWSSVINGRCPSPEQRRDALAERVNVSELFQRVKPAMDELLVVLHSLQMYVATLPVAEASSGGWEQTAQILHPRATVDMLNSSIDKVRAIRSLNPEDTCFTAIWDQLMLMARWSRESVNPSAEERAKISFRVLTQSQMDTSTREAVERFCKSFHDFCELYAEFPVLPAVPRMDLTLLSPDFRKE